MMNSKEKDLKVTVQGVGSPVPAVIESEQAGFQPSSSNDRNATTVGDLASVADNVSRNRSSPSKGGSSSQKTLGRTLEKPGPSQKQKGNMPKASSSKHINPSTKAYRERRNAIRTFDAISRIPIEQRTAKQAESIIWAAGIIAQCPKKEQPQRAHSKRQRSQDETTPSKSAPKKAKTASYSEITKSDLTVAVIDSSNADGEISAKNWKKVEVGLASVFLEVLKENPGTVPTCRDAGWHQGRAKLISCADSRSLDLYKIAISKLGNLWEGATLKVVNRNEIPHRPRSRTWIPAEPSEPETVMAIIKCSNPQLPVDNWKLVRLEEAKGDSRQAMLVLNKESLGILAKSRGVISYGFSSITLKIYKSDLPEPAGPTSVKEVKTAGEGTSSHKPDAASLSAASAASISEAESDISAGCADLKTLLQAVSDSEEESSDTTIVENMEEEDGA